MAATLAKALLLLIACVAAEYRRPVAKQSGRLRKHSRHHPLSKGVREAIFRALGDSPNDWLVQIRKQLKSTWRSLPKVEGDRVDRHTLRLAVHGHFMRQHGLWVRGLAPPMGSGGSCALGHGQCMWEPATADALERVLPRYQGAFSPEDAVTVVGALRRLALGADRQLLDAAYRYHGADAGARLHRKEMTKVLTTYAANWMSGYAHTVQNLLDAEQLPVELDQIKTLVAGCLDAMEDRRATAADGRSLEKQAPFFSPGEAEETAAVVALTFARLKEPQCREMRFAAADYDEKDTGRIRLKDFHRTRHSGAWHFSESVEALREMGVLDEGDGSKQPRVLIPNYLQAAPNCMVSTPEYRVCCMDDCARLARKVEVAVHNATASPKQLLRLARDFAPEPPHSADLPSPKAAARALNKLAASQGGRVSLHGRAYAQWLHIAFPWACPLPRDAPTGRVSDTATGSSSAERVLALTRRPRALTGHLPENGTLGDSQERPPQMVQEPEFDRSWEPADEEEELPREPVELGAPWESVSGRSAVLAMAAVSMAGALGFSRLRSRVQPHGDAKLHLG